MSSKNQSILDQAIASLQTEAEDTAGRVAEHLSSEIVSPSENLTTPQKLDYLARNWADPAFRQRQLQLAGAQNFLAMVQAAEKRGHNLGAIAVSGQQIPTAGSPAETAMQNGPLAQMQGAAGLSSTTANANDGGSMNNG